MLVQLQHISLSRDGLAISFSRTSHERLRASWAINMIKTLSSMHINFGDRFIYTEMQGLLLRLKELVFLQHRWSLMAVVSHRFHCTNPL